MYKVSFVILVMLQSLSAFADCEFPVNELGAVYKVEQLQTGEHATAEARKITLWRSGGEVAHEFQDSKITEIWNLVSDGRVRPVRYFDDYQRAIEYQPNEVNNGRGERDWSAKFQLVSDSLLTQMSLQSTEGLDCDAVESYVLEKDGRIVELDWLPNKKLLKQFTETQGEVSVRYTLVDVITDNQVVKQHFAKWQSYQSTDYADIGDDHTDPFLLEMVNLGFVEHASGFYNEDGSRIEGHQH